MSKHYRFQMESVLQMVAKNARGGIRAISDAMGVSEKVLSMKLNPSCESHLVNLGDAAAITAITQDYAIADAFAALCNRTTLDLKPVGTCVETVGEELEKLTKEFSDCVPGLIARHKSVGLNRQESLRLQKDLMELAQLSVFIAREIGGEYGGE